jgi:DNA polymerase III delta prime subunit
MRVLEWDATMHPDADGSLGYEELTLGEYKILKARYERERAGTTIENAVARYFIDEKTGETWQRAPGEEMAPDETQFEVSKDAYDQAVAEDTRTLAGHVVPAKQPDVVRRRVEPSAATAADPEPIAAPIATGAPLHVRLRPTSFGGVVGQDAAVKALARLVASANPPHLFLLTGPSGTGKTTLARILARCLGAHAPTEMDAATHSGVDDTRAITEWASYSTLDGGKKVLILDEVHALSKAAWQALLKIMEEPPAHVFFMLCTTDVDKVPATIKTRAHAVKLREVPIGELDTYAQNVIEAEQLAIPDGALRFITGSAGGSVRQLLVSLSLCNGAKDVAECQTLLEQTVEDDNLRNLMQLCVSARRSYERAHKMLAVLKAGSGEAEGIRIQLISYIQSVFFNSEKPREDLISLMDALSKPCPARGDWAHLGLALYFGLGGGAQS